MPDITMCDDESCPKRKDCYLFMAVPSKFRQSYFFESPRDGDACDFFRKIKKGDPLKDVSDNT